MVKDKEKNFNTIEVINTFSFFIKKTKEIESEFSKLTAVLGLFFPLLFVIVIGYLWLVLIKIKLPDMLE